MQWNPQVIPQVDLTESDVSLTAEELIGFHEQFQNAFGRKEQGRLGLPRDQEAKSVEPIMTD